MLTNYKRYYKLAMNWSEQLCFWRKHKNFSQLDLAVEHGVSSKHISFIETGRSKPSKK